MLRLMILRFQHFQSSRSPDFQTLDAGVKVPVDKLFSLFVAQAAKKKMEEAAAAEAESKKVPVQPRH